MSPVSGGEHEGVGAVELGFGTDFEGALEVVLGFARETNDEVGGNGQVGNAVAGGGQAVEIPRGGVTTAHGDQDGVTA